MASSQKDPPKPDMEAFRNADIQMKQQIVYICTTTLQDCFKPENKLHFWLQLQLWWKFGV